MVFVSFLLFLFYWYIFEYLFCFFPIIKKTKERMREKKILFLILLYFLILICLRNCLASTLPWNSRKFNWKSFNHMSFLFDYTYIRFLAIFLSVFRSFQKRIMINRLFFDESYSRYKQIYEQKMKKRKIAIVYREKSNEEWSEAFLFWTEIYQSICILSKGFIYVRTHNLWILQQCH